MDERRAVICLPTYDERENLAPILDAIHAVEPRVDVLVVDDASPDGTGDLADAIAARDGRVRVLHRPGKQGLGRAYLAGFSWALARGYDLVLEMDADFSHDPVHLPAILAGARRADLVLGSRYVPGGRTVDWGLARKLVSRGGSLYARKILGLPLRDLTGGFKCFRREVLEAIDLPSVSSSGYAFQIELTFRAVQRGFRVMEVPITFADRRVGRSKMSSGIVLEAMKNVWAMRFSAFARAARAAGPVHAHSRA
jgi:dolichol-phosphate mannosyltransferase